MRAVKIAGWGVVYSLALMLTAILVERGFELRREGPGTGVLVVSDWQGGKRVARHVVQSLDAAPSPNPAAMRIVDAIIDDGPVLGTSSLLFGASFAPADDGLQATFEDRSAVLTPNDLLVQGAYEKAVPETKSILPIGVNRDRVVAVLSSELQVQPSELLARGRFRRVSLRREDPRPPAPLELTIENLERSVLAAAGYLANQVKLDGSFRYELDPHTNQDVEGYSWPRHAGATWFLAQVAKHTGNRRLAASAKMAASQMIVQASLRCAGRRCIGDGNNANIGSAALGLLALVELVEAGLLPDAAGPASELADFLRSQQRPDGEFMHEFDLSTGRPIDVQHAYFTGEAAFALSRAHRITRDPRDLEAAKRALSFLVGRPFWAAGMRYFWSSEHWTCQAMEDLWERAPNYEALEFCLNWQEYNRGLMLEKGPFRGVMTANPYQALRFIASASRTEAAVATLRIARLAQIPERRLAKLEDGIRQTLGMLLNVQFMPGPTYLMPNPALAYGGFPGGRIDHRIRIDYPQHAGSALLRYLRLLLPAATKQP